jgi:hypothetical protein
MKRRRLFFWQPDVALTALGLLGLILFLVLYDQAFPSAALDLTLSREEIAERATAYMSQRGHDLGAYQTALTFEDAWLPSVYLQQTLGIPRTNDLAQQEGLALWFWQMRWFRPLQKEEFGLSLMPDGTVVAMSHTLLEEAPGADLPRAQAQSLAETYLAGDRGWNLANWDLVTASTETQPGGRADHHFEWKRLDWNVGDSELRLAVDVQGDQVGGYGYWLQVPEAFERRFAEQRSRAGFISNLAYYLSVGGFGLVVAIFFFLGHRRGIFPWHEGLRAGLLVGAVYLLYALNVLPLSKAYYGTTQDYPVFWIDQLIDTFITTVFVAGAVTVLWGGGRYLARRVWPRQDKLLPRSDDRWIVLSGSTWRGLMVGGLHSGYVVAFYLLATQVLGGWTPMDSPDVNLYATPLPFSAALAVGVIPAVTEEFLARLAGIGFLLLVTRQRWLAVLVPGVLWAFAHLSYVRDPLYLRGVELTVVALFYGYIFLRFGLATTIVAHLAYNAGLTALPLLRSGEPSLLLNGALVVAILLAPAIPGAIQLLRRRFGAVPARGHPAIHPCAEEDLAHLSLLRPGEAWSEWLADPATEVLGLWAGGDLIGAAAGQVQPDGEGQVRALFVAPDWRRHYWGSHLAQVLDEELQGQGARSLKVTVQARDWVLARFWDAQGWSPDSVSYVHHTPKAG